MQKRTIFLSICLSVFLSVSSYAADVVIPGSLSATSDTVTGPVVMGSASAAVGIGVQGVATGGLGIGVYGYASASNGTAGYFDGAVVVEGNVDVWGTSSVHGTSNVFGDFNVSNGTKNFIQPHAKDPSKEVVYVAAEGPEAMVFFRGTGALKNGKAVIKLPDYFSMVAGKEGVMVQFTPRSNRSKGLAAVKVSNERIVVQELMRGKGEYEFDYFVTAKRAGYESHQPVADNTHFKPAANETAKVFEDRYKGDAMSMKALRALLISNGILTPGGNLNRDLVAKLGWKVREEELALLSK